MYSNKTPTHIVKLLTATTTIYNRMTVGTMRLTLLMTMAPNINIRTMSYTRGMVTAIRVMQRATTGIRTTEDKSGTSRIRILTPDRAFLTMRDNMMTMRCGSVGHFVSRLDAMEALLNVGDALPSCQCLALKLMESLFIVLDSTVRSLVGHAHPIHWLSTRYDRGIPLRGFLQ